MGTLMGALMGILLIVGGAHPSNATTKEQGYIAHSKARFLILDKITERTKTVSISLGKPFRVADLTIIVSHCRQRPPSLEGEAKNEYAAYVEAYFEEYAEAFKGWIFSQRPALRQLPHEQITLKLLECL